MSETEVRFSQVDLPKAMHVPDGVLATYLPHDAEEVYNHVYTRLINAPIDGVLQADYPNMLPWSDRLLLARRAPQLANWRSVQKRTLEKEEVFELYVQPDSMISLDNGEAHFQIAEALAAYSGLIYIARSRLGWKNDKAAERNMRAALLERDVHFGWMAWSGLHQEYLKRKIALADDILGSA